MVGKLIDKLIRQENMPRNEQVILYRAIMTGIESEIGSMVAIEATYGAETFDTSGKVNKLLKFYEVFYREIQKIIHESDNDEGEIL